MLEKAPGAIWSPERTPKMPRELRAKLDACASSPESILFLDIETTGLSHYYDEITVVGWSLGGRHQTFIRGGDPSELMNDAAKAKAMVTFNGIRFDTRFLRQEHPDIRLPSLHVDLMYLCRRVGLKGGQKSIERQLELDFRLGLHEVDGFAAVLLWHRYQRGDVEALQRLIRYNRADIAAMGALFDEAISRLTVSRDLFSSQTTFLEWSAPEGWNEPPQLDALPLALEKSASFETVFGSHRAATATVVGIDLTGSERRPSGWARLDGSLAATRSISSDDDLLAATIDARPQLVSIDSPLCLPAGRLTPFDDDVHRQKYGIMRWSERELKRRGVNVYPCLLPSMQKLTERGMRLAGKLRSLGIPVIESYPGAAQDIMRIPRKGAGEVWLKTGLMEFGIEGDYQATKVSHDELDAITSALVGTFHLASMTEALGTPDELPLIIPMPKAEPGPTVIGISGAIGAGKTTLSKLIEREGFAYTRFSLVLDDLLAERGVPATRATRQALGLELNERGRQRWLAEMTLARVQGASRIVVDGMRFPDDHAFLVERFGLEFRHVHVVATDGERHLRSPETLEPLVERAEVERMSSDMRNIASVVIYNSGDIAELALCARRIVKSAD